MTELILLITLVLTADVKDFDVSHWEQVTVRERSYDDLERYPSHGVDSSYPDWFRPDLLNAHGDISYWLSILPFAQDKDLSRYLVAPLQGAIVPVVSLPDGNGGSELIGENIDIMTYLEDGAVQHPGTIGPWEGAGNYVLAGHTSYFDYRGGRYKTAMQFLALMQSGDPLWLFDKGPDGEWVRYDFSVTDSYSTSPDNVSILNQPVSGNFFTLYGCYPFGTLDERRVIESQLTPSA